MSENLYSEESVHIELYNPDSTVVPNKELDTFGNFSTGETELDSVKNYLTEEYNNSFREKKHSQIFTTQKPPILSVGIPKVMGTKQLIGDEITMQNLKQILQKD